MGKTDGVILMMNGFKSALFVGVDNDFRSRILFRDEEHSIQNDLSASISEDIIYSQTDARWKLVLAATITGLFGARDKKLDPEDVAQIILDLFEKFDSQGNITIQS